MIDRFIARTRQRGLSAEEAAVLKDSYLAVSRIDAKSDIVDQGAPSDHLHIILDGWACKYKALEDGSRQIVSVHLPGDVCDLDKIFQGDICFGVTAISECRTVSIALSSLRSLINHRTAVRDFFWSSTVRENAALIEFLSMNGRSPRARIAYLLSDLMFRLETVKETKNDVFRLELRQSDIADFLGLSTVHVNKTMQKLKAEGLFEVSGRDVRVRDRGALEKLGNFDRLAALTRLG